MWYAIARRFLFCFSPELSHQIAMGILQPLAKWWGGRQRSNNTSFTLAGIPCKNGVGLAAGFDKNAKYLDALEWLGFGYVEIGTVTPRPQSGNPPPRLFRLVQDHALINRMGFNNDGVEVIGRRLQGFRRRNTTLVIGGNIGKNKDTPQETAELDYLKCFTVLYPYVDYFTLNVSSPNTPGLRDLQDKEPLERLLKTIITANQSTPVPRPLFLKIAPDLNDAQVRSIGALCRAHGIAGIIATNTSLDRSTLITPLSILTTIGAGGLSGAPLTHRTCEILNILSEVCGPSMILIASGGMMTEEDGVKAIRAGAKSIQLYTGFIYSGPALIKKMCRVLQDSSINS